LLGGMGDFEVFRVNGLYDQHIYICTYTYIYKKSTGPRNPPKDKLRGQTHAGLKSLFSDGSSMPVCITSTHRTQAKCTNTKEVLFRGVGSCDRGDMSRGEYTCFEKYDFLLLQRYPREYHLHKYFIKSEPEICS